MADPVNGPAQVSGDWIERFGMDGLGLLVNAWKASMGIGSRDRRWARARVRSGAWRRRSPATRPRPCGDAL
jgi:hypothetical protein